MTVRRRLWRAHNIPKFTQDSSAKRHCTSTIDFCVKDVSVIAPSFHNIVYCIIALLGPPVLSMCTASPERRNNDQRLRALRFRNEKILRGDKRERETERGREISLQAFTRSRLRYFCGSSPWFSFSHTYTYTRTTQYSFLVHDKGALKTTGIIMCIMVGIVGEDMVHQNSIFVF